MTELAKIKPGHLRRTACVYLRQSSQTQVEFNRESTERQYALVARATELAGHTSRLPSSMRISPPTPGRWPTAPVVP